MFFTVRQAIDMSAVKRRWFNFVKRKSTAKQAKATEDPSNQESEQHQLII